MNYERGVKIVFGLWGVYYVIRIFINLKVLILGIEVPKYISKYIDTSLYTVNMSATYSALMRPVIISIAILILIIFAYRGKKWAYYGFIVLLFYNIIDNLSFLPVMFAHRTTHILPPHIEMYLFWGSLVWSVLLISGSIISIYILYMNKRSILPLNYKEAVKSIYYLWSVFAAVKIIGSFTYVYYRIRLKTPFPVGNDFYFGILYMIFCIGIFILAVFAYKRKKWGYHGFIWWLVYGLLLVVTETYWNCECAIDALTLYFFLIPALFLVFASGISLYILYKNQRGTDVFSS